MKIFIAVQSAIMGSLKSWRVLLIMWFVSLLLVSLVVIPMKGALNSDFRTSMITEKFSDGFNIEVFTDLGTNLKSLISYFTAGFFMVIFIGFLLNAFMTGGLFNSLRKTNADFSVVESFRVSAKKFWSFLGISLIINVIGIILLAVVIIFPTAIATLSQGEMPAGSAVFKMIIIVLPVFLLLLTLLLLVADYARAWQVAKEPNNCFRAVGFGFRQTFRTFFSSYLLMILLLIVQFLYGWLVISILPGMRPVTGRGVFLLFILSQFLFFVKILLKAWLYGSVTSLMEQNSPHP
jgi:hypothetical protein